jgi:predicted membrane channel-forming protein YqfA (hemolysin III family)
VVLFLIRLYQVFEPLLRMRVFETGLTAPLLLGAKLTPLGQAVLTSGSYLVLSLVGIIVLIGFMRLHRWAWVLLMAWTGVSLTITLIAYFYSRPNYLVMASDIIIAFALSQADVQRIFGIRTDQGEYIK